MPYMNFFFQYVGIETILRNGIRYDEQICKC